MYIDDQFRRTFERHIAGNLILSRTESPLILGIFGPPGEGKTYQVDHLLTQLGLRELLISPGELESENAGHPGALIRQQYIKAGSVTGPQGVLVINDIDTVLGNWGPLVQYTVNRQTVYGELMALCDHPLTVAGQQTRRTPIILTGNHPDLLYGPLLRPGRARIYEWKPTPNTRFPVIKSLFPEIEEGALARLVGAHAQQSVAFWADARAALWEERLDRWIDAHGRGGMHQMLAHRAEMTMVSEPVDLRELAPVVSRLAATGLRLGVQSPEKSPYVSLT